MILYKDQYLFQFLITVYRIAMINNRADVEIGRNMFNGSTSHPNYY